MEHPILNTWTHHLNNAHLNEWDVEIYRVGVCLRFALRIYTFLSLLSYSLISIRKVFCLKRACCNLYRIM